MRTGLEALSGFDLSDVRIHRDSPRPATVNADAFASGRDIYLAHGQERHLAHEAWHVVQQRQGRLGRGSFLFRGSSIHDDPSLEREADSMGARALTMLPTATQPLSRGQHVAGAPIQRRVRIGGGAQHVNEADYQPGGSRAGIGSRFSVAALITDGVRRVFNDVAELESYANGRTDYIGDVVTGSADRYWYRLPPTQVTVLGEDHSNPLGTVEDVILGVRTSRFMYEPLNQLTALSALNLPFTGTRATVAALSRGRRVSPLIDRAHFNPDLEDITIKALGAATMTRQFARANPARLRGHDRRYWEGRATLSDHSDGERTALYLAAAIHIAQDLATHAFGAPGRGESEYIRSARRLVQLYQGDRAVLDAFMTAKDADPLIGIYELTAPHGFRNLPVLRRFARRFHTYGSRYIEQLGNERNDAALQAQGRSLARASAPVLANLDRPREEIMWGRIQDAVANNYLIVGMGDRHRQNLAPRLNTAGIPHEEVAASLVRQQNAVDAAWRP